MINNRQGGRRRGRGGQRPQNLGGQPGNRQDNRQRGNAAQLLEKYKNMARDAQLAGDRVQSEYYLQFAEHYFRALGESRARFEEQRRQRGDDGSDEDGDDELVDASEEQREPREQRPPREQRHRRPQNQSNGGRHGSDSDDEERIALEVLPPAIGRETEDDSDDDAEPVAVKPRRRTRRPRADDSEGEIAPAA